MNVLIHAKMIIFINMNIIKFVMTNALMEQFMMKMRKFVLMKKNIYTTFITTEILKDNLNSIKSTFIDINFSYIINESNTIIPSGQINFSTTSFLDKIFDTTIFSTYSNDEIIETSFMKIIQESTFPQENISQSALEIIQSSYNQINDTQKN